MRFRLFFLLLAAAPAPLLAQASPSPLLDALNRSFPEEHRALADALAGQDPAESRRLVNAAMERFQQRHADSILAAPAPILIALEARHAALLRAIEAEDVRHCAVVGDRGFFSREARAGGLPPGLDDYALALVQAAVAGRGRPAVEPPTAEHLIPWMETIERREPGVPVRAMLQDRELRSRASAEHLCVGAAAMHEAVAELAPEAAARVAWLLVGSLIRAGTP